MDSTDRRGLRGVFDRRPSGSLPPPSIDCRSGWPPRNQPHARLLDETSGERLVGLRVGAQDDRPVLEVVRPARNVREEPGRPPSGAMAQLLAEDWQVWADR